MIIPDRNPIGNRSEVYGRFVSIVLRSEYGRRSTVHSRRSSLIGNWSEVFGRFSPISLRLEIIRCSVVRRSSLIKIQSEIGWTFTVDCFTVGLQSEIYGVQLTVVSDRNPIGNWSEVSDRLFYCRNTVRDMWQIYHFFPLYR